MKKVVWIVNQFAISPEMTGGTRHYELAHYLKNEGFEVFIIASDFSAFDLKFKKLSENQSYKIENYLGVKFLWVKTLSYKKNNYMRLINQYVFAFNTYKISEKLPRPIVIIGSSPQLITAFTALLLSIKRRAKFIGEIRDLWPETLLQLKPSMKYNPYYYFLKMIEQVLYFKSKFIVVVVERFGNFIARTKKDRNKILCVPNGISKFVFDESLECKIDYNFNNKKFKVIYAGAFGLANNLEILIEVSKRIKEYPIEMILIGDGPKKKELNDIIKEQNIENLKLFDPVSKSEILNIVKKADIGLLILKDIPLFKLGISPNKLFDYMLAGKPVVCSLPKGVFGSLENVKSLHIVTPNDPIELSKKIIELSQMDREKLHQLGVMGYDFVLENYSRDKLFQPLLKVIKKYGG